MSKHIQRQQGFTLLEIMIALTGIRERRVAQLCFRQLVFRHPARLQRIAQAMGKAHVQRDGVHQRQRGGGGDKPLHAVPAEFR